MRYPVDQRIVIPSHIPFGGQDSNAKYGRHSGDDSANDCGTPVYAPASGTVTGYSSGQYHGNVVEIFDGNYYPHVFHLKSRSVSSGQQVSEGQLIGHVGTTGLSTGCHIHFGVSTKSVPQTTSFNDFIDPLEYIKKGENMNGTPNDGDITNMLRLAHQQPTYQPTGDEFQRYKQADWGWKKLAYDTTAAMQASIDKLKAEQTTQYVKVSDLFVKKG